MYFACGWVIRPDVDYAKLRDMAVAADCELAAVSPLYTSQEGYVVMTFAVRVASEGLLVDFIKEAGAAYGLTHWYGVPQEYYEGGQTFDVAQMPPRILELWLAAMQKYGQHNEAIRRSLNP